MSLRISFTIGAICVACASAPAGVVVEAFHDRQSWVSAVGGYSTLDFQGIPDNDFVTDQYAHLGVYFTGGVNQIFMSPGFLQDGVGIFAGPATTLQFDQPMFWIAADFPGHLDFTLINDGAIIYESGIFGASGTGNFGGLLSDTGFDEVIITDPLGTNAFIDDIYFGPPIPAPAALPLLALGLLAAGRQRRSDD